MHMHPDEKTVTPLAALKASLLAAGLLLLPVSAHAAGGGSPAPVSCPKGKVYSESKKKCVKIHSNLLKDEERYKQGWALAKHGYYEKAIEVLKTADQNDPRVLNYLGYSYRKSGDLKTGIRYYKAALAIDPNFVLAREYLGEGYVKAGRLDLAKLELEQIKKICGTTCEEYVELAQVILTGTERTRW
ncbi:MAG: tetratricopeptide repeat protein [Methyloligellaceae bacterium]